MIFIGHFEVNFTDCKSNLTVMKKQKEIILYAVSMILKAALLAAVWAGKYRKRGLESIAKMSIDF